MRRRSAFADVLEAARRELDSTGKGIKKAYALVPLVDGVIVHERGRNLDHAEEALVELGAIIDVERELRLRRCDVAVNFS